MSAYAYIEEDKVIIGNDYIERRFSTKDNRLTTTEIVNKRIEGGKSLKFQSFSAEFFVGFRRKKMFGYTTDFLSSNELKVQNVNVLKRRVEFVFEPYTYNGARITFIMNVEIEDDKLYRVVTDFYSSQMLAGVTDLSYGLLKLEPKFADGTPVENFEDAIIYAGDQELKAWVAIAEYMDSFEDNDCDDIGEVPAKYNTQEGRKVVEDSKKIGDLLKNPNKFFFIIIALVLVVLAILTGIIVLIVKVTKKIVKSCKAKKEE